MDYCYIEWFALETNRDHSVVFEIASKNCISELIVMQKSNCRKNKSRQNDFFLQLDDCSRNTNVENFQSIEILNMMQCERIPLGFLSSRHDQPETYAMRKGTASNTEDALSMLCGLARPQWQHMVGE